MKRNFFIAALCLLMAAPLFTSCGFGGSSSKWKKVSNLDEFKQQFVGTTWIARDTYDSKFVINSNNTLTKYFRLPNHDWKKERDYNYKVYEFDDEYRGGKYIQVTFDNGDVMFFESDGTPKYFSHLGMNNGYLSLEE